MEQLQQTILIVEDYADARNLMKTLVLSLGHQALIAVDGNKAVECVEEMRPDLILMDLSLPLMDGLTATRYIRTLDNGRNVPIICVTAHNNYYQKMALEAGCNEVISKPVDINVLETTISKYLSATV